MQKSADDYRKLREYMAGGNFTFKRFGIQQSDCAQKVCTEACIFGAVISTSIPEESTVLDIGSGTGLLSLMIAQNVDANIDGVEIDPLCSAQSYQNLQTAKFPHQIDFYHLDIRSADHLPQYDWIVSNPPFYNNTLASKNTDKARAKHTQTLSPDDWNTILDRHTHSHSKVALLLTKNDIMYQYLEVLKRHQFHINHKIDIRDQEDKDLKTVIFIASRTSSEFTKTDFIIKEDDGNYTQQMQNLLKDYYLHI